MTACRWCDADYHVLCTTSGRCCCPIDPAKESKQQRFERLEHERLDNRPEPVEVAGLQLLVRAAVARTWPAPRCAHPWWTIAGMLIARADTFEPTAAGVLVHPRRWSTAGRSPRPTP